MLEALQCKGTSLKIFFNLADHLWEQSPVYEGCPSKSWTFVITLSCVQVTL